MAFGEWFKSVFERVPLYQQQHVWFTHDGAPPHFPRIVRQHRNHILGEQFTGRRGPVNWSARSPDLNSLDPWLWGHLKTSVHSVPISDLEVLQQRVENASQGILAKPGFFDRARTSVQWRAERCVVMHGNNTQQRSYLSRRWFLDVCWLEIFAHLSEYYTPSRLKPTFNNLYQLKNCYRSIQNILQHTSKLKNGIRQFPKYLLFM
jgi:hypothetical protein